MGRTNVGWVVQHGGVTRESLALWDLLRESVPPVTEAWIGMSPEAFTFDPVHQDGREGLADLVRGTQWVFHGLALAFEHHPEDPRWSGGMLFLSGCSAGYGGEGPRGTEQVLREAGFPDDHAALAYEYDILHLVSGEVTPRVARVRADRSSPSVDSIQRVNLRTSRESFWSRWRKEPG